MFKKSDWQKKYDGLSDDYRQLEKASALATNEYDEQIMLLRTALRQTSTQLMGSDGETDQYLKALLTAIDEPDLRSLKKLTRQFDKTLRASEDKHNHAAHELLEALRRWSSELRTLTQQDTHLTSIDLIRSQSSDAVNTFRETANIITRLVGLQAKVFDTLNQGDTLSFSSLTQHQAEINEENALVMKCIAGDLLSLIDGIHLAPEHREMAEQLIEDLETGSDLTQLPKLMHRCVTLLTQYSRGITDEFEDYLLATSKQLADIQTYINVNHEQAVNDGEERLRKSTQVYDEVSSLKDSATKASDLAQLKAAVQNQFSKVHEAVNELKTSEASRIKETKQQHSHLKEKLAAAEEHAQKTMEKVEEERLRSRIDPLTELPNRTAYNERIKLELDRVYSFRSNLCLAICDIDHFKKINDSFGHLAGDKALQLLGIILRDYLPETDFIARIGGEEFVILLPNRTLDEARVLLDKVRDAIAISPFNNQGQPVPIKVSMGITIAHGLDTINSVFERADQHLYAAKNSGRNRVCAGADTPESL